MNYLVPMDITNNKLFAILSISLIENLGHRIKFNIIDILYMNDDLDWIKHLLNTRNTSEIKNMFENDVYSPHDVVNEQDIIEKIFNGGI